MGKEEEESRGFFFPGGFQSAVRYLIFILKKGAGGGGGRREYRVTSLSKCQGKEKKKIKRKGREGHHQLGFRPTAAGAGGAHPSARDDHLTLYAMFY